MIHIPDHTSPPYSEEARANALFHYTTASGLIGILKSNELWSTAYHCANDASELSAGKGVLTPFFRTTARDLIKRSDPLARTFAERGVSILEHADQFEGVCLSYALKFMSIYITCFCMATSEDDFHHGLLSQWRGYGTDGGYALQFNRRKLREAVDEVQRNGGLSLELQDVFYAFDNPLKPEVMKHSSEYEGAFIGYLNELANFDFTKKTMQSPLKNLTGGPLQNLLEFFIHTKNQHFREERECRLSLLEATSNDSRAAIDYFNRGGLIVPFARIPPSAINVRDCLDWIIVGPSPRLDARFRSIVQIVKGLGLETKVRPSHIPLSRQ